jgi:hypothetical protein
MHRPGDQQHRRAVEQGPHGQLRRMDRDSMSFVFDLSSCDDGKKHALEILRRLDNGNDAP